MSRIFRPFEIPQAIMGPEHCVVGSNPSSVRVGSTELVRESVFVIENDRGCHGSSHMTRDQNEPKPRTDDTLVERTEEPPRLHGHT